MVSEAGEAEGIPILFPNYQVHMPEQSTRELPAGHKLKL